MSGRFEPTTRAAVLSRLPPPRPARASANPASVWEIFSIRGTMFSWHAGRHGASGKDDNGSAQSGPEKGLRQAENRIGAVVDAQPELVPHAGPSGRSHGPALPPQSQARGGGALDQGARLGPCPGGGAVGRRALKARPGTMAEPWLEGRPTMRAFRGRRVFSRSRRWSSRAPAPAAPGAPSR